MGREDGKNPAMTAVDELGGRRAEGCSSEGDRELRDTFLSFFNLKILKNFIHERERGRDIGRGRRQRQRQRERRQRHQAPRGSLMWDSIPGS